MINIDNIKKSFGDKLVLDGIDIKVDKGTIYGLLGPSGSGKTTLINIMIGKIKSFSGDLHIMNHDKYQLTKKLFKEKLGIMSDSSSAYSRLTVEENLYFFANIYSAKKSMPIWIMKELLIYDHRKETFKNLSKGMKQRVLLGIALINNPELLILDEPTSSLDPKTTEKIHELIEKLKEKGTTIFLTTHDMEEAERLCDQISILHQGKIKAHGNPKRILHRKKEILIKTTQSNYRLLQNGSLHLDLNRIMEKEEIIDINVNQQTLRNKFIKITTESEDV